MKKKKERVRPAAEEYFPGKQLVHGTAGRGSLIHSSAIKTHEDLASVKTLLRARRKRLPDAPASEYCTLMSGLDVKEKSNAHHSFQMMTFARVHGMPFSLKKNGQ